MGNNRPADDSLTPWIRGFIRQQAQRVVHGANLPRHDQEDVESDLCAHLLERQNTYDAARGKWSTFARNVIENKAGVLLDHYRADCRARRHEAYSVDGQTLMTDDRERRGTERFDADAYRRRIGPEGGVPEQRLNEAIDVAASIERLRPADQRIARLLMKHRVADVAREAGIPRGTVYEAIRRIRESFEADRTDKRRPPRRFEARSSKS